jgi:hypothetical protein
MNIIELQSQHLPIKYQTSISTDYHIQEYDYSIADEFGNRKWLLNNLLHRTDGPAIDCKNGKTEWWLDGKQYNNGIDISNVIAGVSYYGQ